jgi:hypothetical protein
LVLAILFSSVCVSIGELQSGRIRSDDEPQLVTWRVLEGITEPFQSGTDSVVPVWKQMKASADQKAADQALQQALHEYGQLIRHPYLFGEVPSQEKYDVFLSMAKLLMAMGFHQRAEVLLYEAMSYTKDAYEAHLQLGLLSLDREDLDKAKVHFKNCLYYQESDVFILTYLSMVLLAEGKTHEAKFFLGRIVSALQSKLQRLSFLLSEAELKATTAPMEFHKLSVWFEDTLTKVFYGDFRVTPSASVELLRSFSNLYGWVAAEELTGRYVFDLGQALYEGGRAVVGLEMMRRGGASSDPAADGAVSHAIVQLRLAFETPLVPGSLADLVVAYLRMTAHLASTSEDFSVVGVANLLDMAWPLPLLGASALRTAPVLRELLWRFDHGRPAALVGAANWQGYLANGHALAAAHTLWTRHVLQQPLAATDDAAAASDADADADADAATVQVGILGGHFNEHSVGLTVLLRLLSLVDDAGRCAFWTRGGADAGRRAPRLSFTLLSLPLLPDAVTQRIASRVQRVVNVPNEPLRAQDTVAALGLDVLLVPDEQPFPDAAALALQHLRLAPVQICFFVRGVSCAAAADYYLLPDELSDVADAAARSAHAAWKQVHAEQLVQVRWPLVSTAALDAQLATLRGEAAERGAARGPDAELRFAPSQAEGQVFFAGQPVALLVLAPHELHPLMDETLVRVLRAVPTLHLVLAVPQDFFPHLAAGDDADKRRMSWARALVRRLWTRAGASLHMRIRLLPTPLSTRRLWQLMKQSDVVLDAFPLGLSATRLGLALSVGTPVVTLQPGLVLSTPRDDLQELRHRLAQLHHAQPAQTHPVAAYLAQHDVPWLPSTSQVAAFYRRSGLAADLVANSTTHYAQLAIRLLSNREFSYELRVRLLEALDYDAGRADFVDADRSRRDDAADDADAAGARGDLRQAPGARRGASSGDSSRHCEDHDLARFLFRVGQPFATARQRFVRAQLPLLATEAPPATARAAKELRVPDGGGGITAPADRDAGRSDVASDAPWASVLRLFGA